ncbi:MAG: hypothetical protein NW237_16675 [Cyanobacteriota bacterium]|nr:hypothetical protein [Cyanobacteriota bacterium]
MSAFLPNCPPRETVMPTNDLFQTAMKRVVNMIRDIALCDRVKKLGLNVVNVMWEDMARTPGSTWGENISDMTLQVRYPDRPNQKELLPVIRYPNFTDKTGDIPLELIKIKIGNEKGEELQAVTLQEYLTNLSQYISYTEKLHAESQPLLTEQDTHVLVSAQACFLPIPQQGRCSFNPVLFNYQSRRESPAVLAILITTEGSSATVIDNENDLAEWGQNLYFNNNGQKTCLTGERLSDYKENQAQEIALRQGISLEEARAQVTVAQDINMVMVIQVPLKHKELEYLRFDASPGSGELVAGVAFLCEEGSDMEDAVIGYGEDEGEHLELGGHKLERDERYPLRVTVQFYKATSNGIIDDKDLENVHQCIEAAYTSADYIGSLVVGTLEKGALGMGEARPTQPSPSSQAVVTPPKDFLEIVNPFGSHQQPKPGE